MTARDDTQVREGSPAADVPEAAVATPAPPLDSTAATPDGQPSWPSPGPVEAPATGSSASMDERPELLVGGAFVGGLVIAFVLKRAASG